MRSDLLMAHRQRLEDTSRAERALEIRTVRLDSRPRGDHLKFLFGNGFRASP